MKTSAIIVTYNRLNILKKNLYFLLHQSEMLDGIFIINNNSTDGTKKYLNSLDIPNVHPINMKNNLGGAGGFSIGTKIAYEHSSSDYFWLMDDDSMPTANALKSLTTAAVKLHNKFGFLCSNVRWSDGTPCIANVPKVSDNWTEFINDGLVRLKSATFVSVLIRRNTVKKFGLPIADMFIWGDDTEYTTRLSNYNRCYLVADSIVKHDSANNTNSSSGSIFNISSNRIIYYKYEVRNLLYINRRYYSIHRVIRYLLNDIFVFFKIPFYAKNHKMFRCYCVLNGIIKGLFFNPNVKYPK